MDNIAYAYNWLIDKGLSPNAAAGVVGNLKAESGVNPSSNQPDGPGRGIAQWSEGGRWESLKAWAGNRNPEDLDVQLGFLWHELNTGYKHVLTALQNTHNMAQATEVFMKEFEIPADTSPSAVQGRVALADDVRDNVKVRGRDVAGNGGGGGGDGFKEGEFEAMLAASGFPEWLVDEFPALKDIYQDAIKHEWTPDRFIGEVKSSDWYQNRSDAQFQWDTTRDAEKKAQISNFAASLRDQAAQMGVNIGDKKIKQMAEFALRFGYDANPSRIQDMLANQYDYKDNGATGGTIGTALDQIDSIAWEWGLDMTRQMRKKWAEKIATGDADPAAFRDMAEQRARKDYSWLKEAFDAGKTLGEIADPYLQSMSSMLEVSPASISMKDKQIRKALSYTTGQGKNAEEGLAPIYEFENALRQDARWQKTKNAREEYMNFGAQVLQDFGVL